MKSIVTVLAILLMVGALATPTVLGERTSTAAAATTTAPKATLDCWNGNSDVSLMINVKNQGPDDLPAGTTITYSYTKAARSPFKKGSYKLDSMLKVGESRSFLVSPLQDWNPGIYQCSAKILQRASSK